MTYEVWFRTHGEKHRRILEKCTTLKDEEIIAYFRFENMVEKEPDFCPLYAENKKCHPMKVLNCYLCACPYFRFNDEGLFTKEGCTYYSSCSIDAKEGKYFISDTTAHQDCSNCLLPHKEDFIRKVFNRDWFKIMRESSVTKP